MATFREPYINLPERLPNLNDLWNSVGPEADIPVHTRELTITPSDIYGIGRFLYDRTPASFPAGSIELHLPFALAHELRREVTSSMMLSAGGGFQVGSICIFGSYTHLWAMLTCTTPGLKATVERLWFTEHPIGRRLVGLESTLEDRIWAAKSERAAIARDALIEDGILTPKAQEAT